MSQWIDVKQRKPPEWEEVLVLCEHDEHECAQWTGTEWLSTTATDMTYPVEFWMVIPERPSVLGTIGDLVKAKS